MPVRKRAPDDDNKELRSTNRAISTDFYFSVYDQEETFQLTQTNIVPALTMPRTVVWRKSRIREPKNITARVMKYKCHVEAASKTKRRE